MKTAVFTRGVERDFEWKFQGRFSDGESDSETRRKLKDYSISDQIKIDVPGVVIARVGDDFGVLLTGFPTQHRRPAGGFVDASFAFFDLKENEARKLAVGVLKNWTQAAEHLVSSIIRHSPPPCNPEWSFDVVKIGEFVEASQAVKIDDPDCDDRLSCPYIPPADNSFEKYATLVSQQIFSPENGVKVVLSKSHPRNGEADFPDADIVILPGLAERNSPKKKSTRPKGSPKTTSAQPSNPSTSPISSGNSMSSVDSTSDKTSSYPKRSTFDSPTPLSPICTNRRSKLIIIGFSLLVIVGTVTVVYSLNKKKDSEHPDLKSQKSKPVARKEEAASGKDNPVPGTDIIEITPAPNEKAPVTSKEGAQKPQEPEPIEP